MADFVNTVDVIGDEALTRSIIDRTVTEIVDSSVKRLGDLAFRFCQNLTHAKFLSVTYVPADSFYYCPNLEKADFSANCQFSTRSFAYCAKLTALILRSATTCACSGTSAFTGTPIASGTGYIYVPAALMDTYKADSVWSNYAAQFRAIEDYPDICGT